MGTQVLLDDGTVAQGIVPLMKSGAPISSSNPIPVSGAALRALATATIANGTSVSGSIDLTSTALLGFIAPSAWTAAALNIEVSPDGTTWPTAGAFDEFGSAIGQWSALTAGAAYKVDPLAMLPWRYVRLRSGTSGTPVNQAADRAFSIITRPLA